MTGNAWMCRSLSNALSAVIKSQCNRLDTLNISSTGVRYFSVSQSKKMKLVQFTRKDNPLETRVGYVVGDNVVDINKSDSRLSGTLLDILKKGDMEKVRLKKMKLVQFMHKDNPLETRMGYVVGDNVVDINKSDLRLSSTLLDILKKGDFEKVRLMSSKGEGSAAIPLSSVNLVAPISGMDKVICIGLNYKDHCEEQNKPLPPVPIFFSKFSSTVIGPNEPVRLRTNIAKKVDYEVELTLVIGKTASNVKAAEAYDYILGYTVAQDISARDWQKDRNGGQFLLGKAQDTFCPIGPWIVTGDETGDPQNLAIKCSVNGDLRQNSRTDQLIHKIPYVIERLTSLMTLLPGDIILTGTPGGVGLYLDPPQFLKPGDVVRSEIENIGVLETRIDQF